jgi:uncharacterized protein YrrD
MIQLQKIKDICDEHFDDYVIIVCKKDQTWHSYRNKLSAHGMCTLVSNGIMQDWANQHQSQNKKDI